jgi:phosphoribosyl-dephospho-CoA transferase
MFQHEAQSVQTHDLLEVEVKSFLSINPPAWVEKVLHEGPFVVVRRGPSMEQNILVVVRGTARNQRWEASCHPKFVKRIVIPPQLLRRTVPEFRLDAAHALRSLSILERHWSDFDRPWGPDEAVGFELATGHHAVKPEGNLDLVIYVDRSMTASEARSLYQATMDLPATVDILTEIPVCVFSLFEYAFESPALIFLRTPCGFMMGSDPWDEAGIMNSIQVTAT